MDNNSTQRLARLAVNEEGFVFDPQTGESFTVNPSARLIIKALAAGREQSRIADELEQHFAIRHSEAQSDVRDFIEQLRACRLIEA